MSLHVDPSSVPADFPLKKQKLLQMASVKFREAQDWVAFFRDVLGVGGLVDKQFPDREQRAMFERSDEFLDIQRMLAKLREQAAPPREPTKVITVRMPLSLHESLSEEAHAMHTSINKLCISKLLQLIDEQLVPGNATFRRAVATTVGATANPSSSSPTIPNAHDNTPPPNSPR